MASKPSLKTIPFYRFLLRYIALRNDWVKRDELLDAWSKKRNNGAGVTDQYIYETLMKLLGTNCLERRKYDNQRGGRNPFEWRATEQGKKAACELWDDLEYDERTERVRTA